MGRSSLYRQEGLKAAAKEAKIQEAVEGLREKKYASVALACRELGLQRSYHVVCRRFHGKTRPRLHAHKNQQLLTPIQERVLQNWVKWLGSIGLPVSRRTLAPKVTALCGQIPSSKWINRFIRRDPDCSLKRPSRLDPKRAQQFNFTTVNNHFETIQKVFDDDEIPSCNLWNADEIGVQVGGGQKNMGELYLFSSLDHSNYKLESDNLELVTIIECVCADGTASVKPCFVFSGTQHCSDWYDAPNSDGVLIATTDNGWTSEKICYDWFATNFVRDAKAHADPSKPIVLILDGHNSHTSMEVINATLANNIILYQLPPHTTHRLQPCDVGAFGPLKRAWSQRCDNIFEKTGDHMQACDVVREYLVARQISFKTSTIQKAWAKSGISIDETGRPRTTPEIFGSADYAPSVPGSTQLQLPPGYPVFPADESDSESQSDYANSDMDTQPQHHLLHSSRTRHESPPQDKPVGDNTDFLDMKNELVELRKQLKLSEMKAKQADEKREEAETHATLAASHLQCLQGQLNAKSKKRGSGSRNVLIPSRIITSEGGRQEALKQREAREAKAKKEDERKQKKLDETLSIRDRRSREGKDTMSFTGALLKNHKAMVLRDVAWTLDLAEDGTREELITRITAFFEDPANRHLRDDNRYIGLFVSKCTLGKRPQHGFGDLTDENNAIPAGAPSERHCFGVITNTPPIAQESQFEHIFEYAFPAEESEQSQPLHTPGDWGMYHFGPDSRNTRYSCTLPGLQAPATMMGSSSLNFNEGSILSFMRQPPSFIHPQPGPSSYHPTFI